MSAIAQANAFLGNVVRLAVVALVAATGWLGWRAWHGDAEHAREVARLQGELAAKQHELERVELALKLMKVEERVARVVVLDQTPAKAGSRATSRVRFEEVDAGGKTIGTPKEITIDGDLLYVDAWVVKFEDLYVEQGDPLRSASLVLFRRLFGEHQAPSDGVSIDAPGARPAAYGGATGMSELEQTVWKEFWDFANDPRRAAALGIRAAHGEADSIKLKRGAVYTITKRSSGGLTIQPDRTASGSE